jgi:hypothetical protein
MSKGKADRLILRCFEAARKKKLREQCPPTAGTISLAPERKTGTGKINPRKNAGKEE